MRTDGVVVCHDNGWWPAFGKKRGKKPGPPVHDDLVERDFSDGGPNQLWLTDITEHKTAENRLHLCTIMDVFSGRIVGYFIDLRMKSRLVDQVLHNVVARRRDVAGCIALSGHGSQYRSRRFVHALNRHGLLALIGRIGAAGDNAAMEIFFALLQKNVLDRRSWTLKSSCASRSSPGPSGATTDAADKPGSVG